MTELLHALIAFCRERIDEERVDVDHPNTHFDVRRPVEVRCAALDDLVDAMEAASDDGSPLVDEVGIEALQHIGRIWRHHEDYRQEWKPNWTAPNWTKSPDGSEPARGSAS